MNFDIAPNAPTPIYRQIVEQVRRLVASGQLRPGDDVPSVRTVALHHAINPMTVSKAYSLLETEGLLERRRGLGMVIARTGTRSTQQDKLALLRPVLRSATQIAKQLGLDDKQALAAFQTCLNQWSKKEPHEPQ